MRARVLVVDDHPVVRRGLVALMSVEDWVGEISEAATVADATVAAHADPLDLAVVDLRLPDGSGLDVLATLRARAPGCRCVVLTMEPDARTAHAATQAGAVGCLAKDEPPHVIVEALRKALAGDPVDGSTPIPSSGPADDPFAVLSPRDRRLAELVAQGRTNPQIAGALGLSGKTVRNQVSQIAEKLGVHGRVGIVLLSRQHE